MNLQRLALPQVPAAALELAREASRTAPALIFKKSPICPISQRAEQELQRWLDGRSTDLPLAVALVDVIAERGLARGLTELLGIRHESPQALLLVDGELRWHDSHDALTAQEFEAQVDSPRRRG